MKTFILIGCSVGLALLCTGCRLTAPPLPENNPAHAHLDAGTPPAKPVLMKNMDPAALVKPASTTATGESGAHEHHH